MRAGGVAMPTAMTGGAVRGDRGERRSRGLLLRTPARFMRPRLTLIIVVFALLALGLLMIYSSSSIVAMGKDNLEHNAAYFLQRQFLFVLAGIVLALAITFVDYHVLIRLLLRPLWVLSVLALVLIKVSPAGQDVNGASRWITIAGFTLQPSEFAKVVVVLTAAEIATRYFDEDAITFDQFLRLMALGVGIPLLLILFQPDKGTTLICVATLLVMGYLAGVSGRLIAAVGAIGVLAVFAMALRDDYSRQRLLSLLDPWADQFGASYQLVQGFYAFGTGGLFGVGIAMSRQKYSYLPEAHTDFIYAIVGEELGLLGTLGVLAAFALLVWAGFEIARYAPDLAGRLIAAGCTSLLVIQFVVNACGVLGLLPLTGKPVPFLSYGGSSVLSCMMLVGLIGSVSHASRLPETEFDRRRRGVRLALDDVDGAAPSPSLSLVGDPTPRSARHEQPSQPASRTPLASPATVRRSFVVHAGGLASDLDAGDDNPTSPASIRARRQLAERVGGRMSVDAHGRRRIDLGPDPASRLRQVRRSGDAP